MRLNWKEYQIHLPSFMNFLKEEISKSDGIFADEVGFDIIELQPFDQNDLDIINNYYDNLTPESELNKTNRPYVLINALIECKNSTILKPYSSVSILERKVLWNVPLDKNEEDEIINLYGQN